MGSVRTVLFILAAAGLSACAAGRGFGEACTATPDCRAELVCFMNHCDNPGACSGAGSSCRTEADCCGAFVCREGRCALKEARCGDGSCDPGETRLTCCSDCGCASGQSCQANRCITPTPGPVCGNRRCEAGETSATCCTDCGCPAGQACQGNVCRAPAGSTLTWLLQNNCPDVRDIQFRFFAVDRGLVWPGGNLVFTFSYGDTVSQPLSCVAGEKICFGADLPGRGLSWGVNIDHSDPCTDCCRTCANQTVNYGSLECP